jgi:curli production assembly/transport component CsgF
MEYIDLTINRRIVMNKSIMCFVGCILGILFLVPGPAIATELVYTPINPAFGGNPFNAQWLMNSAQAQNKLIDPDAGWKMPETDPIEDFQKSLNRQILYRLANKIIDMAFGEGSLESGHYDLGDYTIDIILTLNGIKIILTDIATGNQTIIEVPYY